MLRSIGRMVAVWCLCAAASLPVSIAGELGGRVTDRSTGEPLVAASIKVESQRLSTAVFRALTDREGYYRLDGLPPDSYQVAFSYVGYSPWVTSPVSIGSAAAADLDAALVPRAIDMEAVVVTASRRPEKYVDAPAAVTRVDADEIRGTVALTTADHLQKLPAVDAASTGLSSSNVVVRGFNNVLSTSLLSLVDYRVAQIPSLRVNAYQFLTSTDADVDRLELVEGPGSALYGPNAATGVMHVITQSPFASQGTTVSLAGGEQSVRIGSLRHAGTLGDRVGFRLSGQYYRASDWAYDDPEEDDTIYLIRQGASGDDTISGPVDNSRDNRVERLTADLRVDWLAFPDGLLVLAGGASRVSNIELTDLGAAQIRDWLYGYGQVRFMYKDLFAQMYVNMGNSKDSYLRQGGEVILDNSRFYATQVQHGFAWTPRVRLSYGIDGQFTRPATDGTLHGRNEERDQINAVGVFAQADLSLSERFAALLAARVDDDNVIERAVISPRAGLTYRPSDEGQLRLMFNRAFGTPSAADLFLDVFLGTEPTPYPFLAQFIGPTLFNVRGAGSVDGFTFRRDGGGRPLMVSLFGDSLESGGFIANADDYLAPTANSVWPALRAMATAQSPSLDAILPDALSAEAAGRFARLNLDTKGFDPVDASSVQDVKPLVETGTSTIEAGYKGRLGSRVAAMASVYYTRKTDFIGPLHVETPHVFLDSAAFVAVLRDDIVSHTGGAMDSASAEATAAVIYSSFAGVPIGLLSPEGVQSATDAIMTRRNFGKVDLAGLDLSASLHVSAHWDVGGHYSFVSKDLFRNVDGVTDIATNSPRHKFGASLQYRSLRRSVEARLAVRWVDGFPVRSGVYIGEVDRYLVLNLNLAYRPLPQTELALSVQNLLDDRHSEFVGAPELGRLAVLRLTQRL